MGGRRFEPCTFRPRSSSWDPAQLGRVRAGREIRRRRQAARGPVPTAASLAAWVLPGREQAARSGQSALAHRALQRADSPDPESGPVDSAEFPGLGGNTEGGLALPPSADCGPIISPRRHDASDQRPARESGARSRSAPSWVPSPTRPPSFPARRGVKDGPEPRLSRGYRVRLRLTCRKGGGATGSAWYVFSVSPWDVSPFFVAAAVSAAPGWFPSGAAETAAATKKRPEKQPVETRNTYSAWGTRVSGAGRHGFPKRNPWHPSSPTTHPGIVATVSPNRAFPGAGRVAPGRQPLTTPMRNSYYKLGRGRVFLSESPFIGPVPWLGIRSF